MASFTRISAADKRRQDDRLTSKHVRTLQFTQSVSEENRRLQERLAELEEHISRESDVDKVYQERLERMETDCLERIERITNELIGKHNQEMTIVLQEKLESEKDSQEDISRLYSKLKDLERSYAELKGTCDSNSSAQELHRDTLEKLKIELNLSESTVAKLQEKNSLLEAENRKLMAAQEQLLLAEKTREREVTKLRKDTSDYKEKLAKLKEELALAVFGAEHRNCTNEINELKERLAVKERELRLKPVEHGPPGDRDKALALEEKCFNYSRELQKVLKDKARLEEELKEREREISDLHSTHDQDLNFLRGENVQLKAKVEQQADELGQLHAELKMKSSKIQDFADFVQLKREVMSLREQNEKLEDRQRRKSETKSLSRRPNIQLDVLSTSGSGSYSRALSVTSTPTLPKLQNSTTAPSTTRTNHK